MPICFLNHGKFKRFVTVSCLFAYMYTILSHLFLYFFLGRGHDFQYVGVFHIHVILKNDHTPTQVVDKIFQVVENGQRLLTNQDLLFVDNDIDTLPINIKYSHHALPNGELVRADTPTEPVFEFTQEDLNERRILFKHIGIVF